MELCHDPTTFLLTFGKMKTTKNYVLQMNAVVRLHQREMMRMLVIRSMVAVHIDGKTVILQLFVSSYSFTLYHDACSFSF